MTTARPSSSRRDRRPAIGSLVAELAITVAILATAWIVTSAAYASYSRGSARAEAQTLVATAAERQAQFFARQKRYADSLTVLDLALPPTLEGRYMVRVTAVDGPSPSFSIVASATGGQATDKCPSLAVDQSGRRTPAYCW